MSEKLHGPDLSQLRNPGVSYERTDANVRGVVWFLVILTVVGVLIHIVLAGMYKYFAGPSVSLYMHQAVGSVYSQPPQPPEPRLQADPVADDNDMRANQNERLNTYGWVDQQQGVTHIPIEDAIDLLAKRGIPARPPQPVAGYRDSLNAGAATAGGLVIPAAEAQKKTPPQK